MNYFREKNIFITGAASGMGLEAAKQLAKAGANLALFDKQDLSTAQKEVLEARANTSQSLIIEQVDVTDFQDLSSTVKAVGQSWGNPDISFHFAGIMGGLDFNKMTKEDFELVIDVNLNGSFNWLKAIQPLLTPGSQVVQVASMASFTGNYGYTSYGTSKYAVWGLIESLRFEWTPLGIKFTVFAPPHVDTPLTEKEAEVMHPAGLDMKKFVGKVSPQKAVQVLLKGVSKKKYLVIPGFMAKLMYYVFKFAPRKLVHLISDWQVKTNLKKAEEQKSENK